MKDIAIQTNQLSKSYKLYDKISDRLKESLHPFRKKYYHDFHALKDINLEVNRGQTLGIIGKNGSGKSTLLKILCGVLSKSSGDYEIKGKISSLLELGAGFNFELTGLENIIFNGAIMGHSGEEMSAKLDPIIEFADIGEYIKQPLKTYSTGMIVRLAFAIAINTNPDILIIDEALAVGDMRFQQKCFRKIRDFKEQNKTIIFVSHDLGSITNFCDKVIWLSEGQIVKYGDPESVCREYTAHMAYDVETKEGIQHPLDIENSHMESTEKCASFGEGGAKILQAGLFSTSGQKIKTLNGGETVTLKMEVKTFQNIESPIVGFIMNDTYTNKITGTNSFISNVKLPGLKGDKRYIFAITFEFPRLRNGQYSFSPAIAEGTNHNHVQHHWVHDAYTVQITDNDKQANMDWYIPLKDPRILMQEN